MTKRYFVLFARDDATSPWCIEFGAYDRDDVVSERQDYRDHGRKASDLLIMQTLDSAQIIAALTASLNDERRAATPRDAGKHPTGYFTAVRDAARDAADD